MDSPQDITDRVDEPRSALLRAIETATAVHLIFHVDHDWEAARPQAVAEAEAKISRLQAYIAAPEFAARHGARTGVLRLQSATAPPSIVAQVLQERGVEIEPLDRPPAEPGQRCELCGRTGLWEDQVTMTGHGWACPSCFRAWRLREDPHLAAAEGPSLLRNGRLLSIGLLLLLLLCALTVLWTLRGMHHMDQVLRSHLPGT